MVPTIHYQMGGVPTNIHGQVVTHDGTSNTVVNGLYAVGECACVSVHGANRLGTNSLLDLLVFGKAAGRHIVEFNQRNAVHKPLPKDAADRTLERLNQLEKSTGGTYSQALAGDIRSTMQQHAGVFRTQASMDEGVVKVAALRERVAGVELRDKSKVFNTARIEALEVDNLIEVAQATMVSAAARKECRGAHTVYDYEHPADHPTAPLGRDDANWLKHTLWHSASNSLTYKPVNLKPSRWTACRPRSGRSNQAAPREKHHAKRTFQIYRYDPDKDAKPYMQTIEIELDGHERMLLDALIKLKEQDPALSFRRSCREGVCGSDAMNINGKNGLACLTNMNTLPGTIVLKPLPGLPVIRDLIVDMTLFFKQYNSIKPYLINDNIPPERNACSRPSSVRSSMACTSASCAPAAPELPQLLVEPRQVCRPRWLAAGLPFPGRQPR